WSAVATNGRHRFPVAMQAQKRCGASLPAALQGRSSGFTLLELLVALTLLGILGGSIAGVLQNSMASIEQGTTAMDNLTRMRSFETMLGGALRDAKVVTVSSQERNGLADDPGYDAADGRYRFLGEELVLGFVLDRPFLDAERDGYTHWIKVEARMDEETGRYSLWLKDISYLQGIDNPVGEDWGDEDFPEDWLPAQEVLLLADASNIFFRYWELEQSGFTDEPEAEEMEPDDIDTDYSVRLPDFIELVLDLPKVGSESLFFDYSIRRKGI
ncbi:MAG: prepilin-type N-terminal cleavage/methylation domain-containing protein, partial [Verrucomicrobia bacterium]|nr:prepilin-type N-terminal cleavage/methylation domain-containing protein [Verrucomicrobiota bacterium]